jgi:HEAT repeat protein
MSSPDALDVLRRLPTSTLVELALRNQREAGATSEGEDLGPLVVLHERANRDVFIAASELARSSDPDERAICARILRELGQGEGRPFSQEALPILKAMAQIETDTDVLACIVSALAWQQEPAALDTVLPFAHHPDGRVRFAVAADPFGMVADPETADPRLIEALIALSSDDDADVRWYATDALANEFPGDGTALRNALANRLADPDQKVSEVAREGLASRHDPRVGT